MTDDLILTISAGNQAALTAAGLDSGWDDHPDFTRADWVEEVRNGDTWLGYPQWVAWAIQVDADTDEVL